MQRTAVVWVVYTLTHSPFMLGLTIFAEQFPSFLLSVFGGVVADRYNRYKVINLTQIASMIQATLLAVLMISGHYKVWEILALSVILGIINAFDIPARQALVHEVLYDKADLHNAISLNSAMASLAGILGPALSGILLAKFGAAICFLINAASFGGVIVAFLFMKLPPYKAPSTPKNVFHELADGFVYLKQTPAIGLVVLMLAFIALLVMPYNTLLPVFAKIVFKGNAATFGYITSFVGVGAVGGTVLLASLKEAENLKFILFFSMIVLGTGLIGFSLISNFPLAMVLAVLTGLGTVAQFTICNIIVQSGSAGHMRGRAISILLMAMFGMLPLGSLLVGAVSEKIGAPATLLCEGITALLIALLFSKFLLRGHVRTGIAEA
jgi:MFS family permease